MTAQNPPPSERRQNKARSEAQADSRVKKLSLLALLLVVGVLTLVLINQESVPENEDKNVGQAKPPSEKVKLDAQLPKVKFKDVTLEWGLDFVHQNGAAGQKLLPETMGSGCAFLDFDGDGDQDLLLVNSKIWDDQAASSLTLYRNLGNRFEDVSQEFGLANISLYGMGASVGDFNNDGFPDFVVTAVGRNRLFINQAGRKFVALKSAEFEANTEWSTGSACLDFDLDGDHDVLVLNYVKWSPEIDRAQEFKLDGIGRSYGPPLSFEGSRMHLFENLGNLKFREVSEAAGLLVLNTFSKAPAAKSLALVVSDLNRDGYPDFVVANDTVRNYAFLNKKNGSFRECGVELGISYDSNGRARGAMGIDLADTRNDGSLAIGIGNFANEMTAMYLAESASDLFFVDEAQSSGIGVATRFSLTFGLVFADYDLDGRLDLMTANGHIEPDIERTQASQHYRQPVELFWNAGKKFVPVTARESGSELFRPLVGRGLAYADIDQDGDLDFLVTANGEAPRLLRNDQEGGKSLRLILKLKDGKTLAYGARARLLVADSWAQRELVSGRSYLSESEGVLTFGLGGAQEAQQLEIHWPGGRVSSYKELSAGLKVLIEPK